MHLAVVALGPPGVCCLLTWQSVVVAGTCLAGHCSLADSLISSLTC